MHCTSRRASARAWSTFPSCCFATTSCSRATTACASITAGASRTYWSTSSRTPTLCSTSGCAYLAGSDAALFAVGDDDQSIYAFRGANVANMQHLQRDFALPDRPLKLIKLEQNYRSHGHILDAANALIKHNQTRLGKNLWTADAAGEPVRAFIAPSDLDEAAFIVDVIKSLVERQRRSRRDRRAVPLQRAVARGRACAVQRRHAVSRLRRHAIFRARRNQARAGVSATDRQRRRRWRVPARGQLSAARGRRAHAGEPAGSRAGIPGRACGRPRAPARLAARPAAASPRSSGRSRRCAARSTASRSPSRSST